MSNVILEMKNITKTFPGVKALDNVNLKVEEGEIHALVGENGAGKSTLMNVLSGIYPYGSYTGDIVYDGEVVSYPTVKSVISDGNCIIEGMENMDAANDLSEPLAYKTDATLRGKSLENLSLIPENGGAIRDRIASTFRNL